MLHRQLLHNKPVPAQLRRRILETEPEGGAQDASSPALLGLQHRFGGALGSPARQGVHAPRLDGGEGLPPGFRGIRDLLGVYDDRRIRLSTTQALGRNPTPQLIHGQPASRPVPGPWVMGTATLIAVMAPRIFALRARQWSNSGRQESQSGFFRSPGRSPATGGRLDGSHLIRRRRKPQTVGPIHARLTG